MLETLFVEQHRQLWGLRRRPDTMPYVCPDSTPVLFFGELEKASVLTVGINPSWREFLSIEKVPLAGAQRRLVHESDMSGDESEDARLALHRMRDYFCSHPDVAYWSWFQPIEHLITSCDWSFKDGSAAHTDVISCFATLPVFGKLPREIQALFACSGYGSLLRILEAATGVKDLLIIGPRARRTFEHDSGLRFQPVNTPFDTDPRVLPFVPVLSKADWRIPSGKDLHVIAVGPYRNRPLSPLTLEEIVILSGYLCPQKWN